MPRNPASADKLIDFLRRCYEADRQGTTLWNLFELPTAKRTWIHKRDPFLRSGFQETASFKPQSLEALFNCAEEVGPAESLVYCPFWIRGVVNRPPLQQPAMVCSPLFMHPIKRSERGLHIEVDLKRRIVNMPLLQALDPSGALREALGRELGDARPIDATTVAGLVDAFKQHRPEVKTDECLFYPEFVTPTQINPKYADDKEEIELVPFGACCLVPRSRAALGVLSELEALSTIADPDVPSGGSELSTSLRIFLGGTLPAPSKSWVQPMVPVDLSVPQQEILKSSSRNVLTQVVGPPGTGKTFTAAALVMGALSRGETVLIVSRQNAAVDVVYRMIEKMKGSSEGVLRAGRKGYLKEMRKQVKLLLNGMVNAGEGKELRRQCFDLRKLVDQQAGELRSMERRFARQIKRDMRDSQRFTRPGMFKPFRRSALKYGPSKRTLVADVFDQLDALHSGAAKLIEVERRAQISELLEFRRQALIEFERVLKSRHIAQTVERLGAVDFPTLLQAFPVWLVNAADLFDVLPMQKGLFDLVIFDEASQCDIASSLPALQRAKRAVVIGDPEQLRHVSFLADKVQQGFADDCGLDATQRDDFDFRRQSLLDTCNRRIVSQNAVMMLDEHFRSHPDIIAFSNRQFYGNCLKVMTNTPVVQTQMALKLMRPPEDWQEFSDGVNKGEVQVLIQVLEELIMSLGREPGTTTIGICSPFRNQVEAIREEVERLPRNWLERHDLQVDTPYGFQGGERDIMLLSLALTHDAHPTAFRYLGRGNVLNVALTRARSQQVVVTSLLSCQAPASEEDLVALLAHLEAQERQEAQFGEPKADPFLDSLRAQLEQRGAITLEDFQLGGEQVDLHIAWDGREFGIDLRGGNGPYHSALSLESCRRFRRAGIPIYVVSYVDWRLRPEECLVGARLFCGKYGVKIP